MKIGTTGWYDKNQFKKKLTTIDSNKFNHKNKVGKFKFNDINNLINNIKNNAISEVFSKQKLDALNEVKKVETKNKRLINGQKILLSFFDDFVEAIFNNNNRSENKNDNASVYDNDVNDDVNHDVNDDDNDNDYYIIKQLINYFKTIEKTKSLKEQIETLKARDFPDEYWHFGYHHGNKELNFKIFKAKAAFILNDLDEQLFDKIFGHTFGALVDKLINTIGEEENKIIIDDIEKLETKFTNKMNVVSSLSNHPINVMIYSMLLKLF